MERDTNGPTVRPTAGRPNRAGGETARSRILGLKEDYTGRKRKNGCAWIVGHSYIHRAQQRSLKRPYREDLELERLGWKLAWLSRRGMQWDELLPFLADRIEMWGIPDNLLIHLGGNDVGHKTCRALLTCIKKDLAQIMIRWPRVKIRWSDIIVCLKNREDAIWCAGVKKLNQQLGNGWVGKEVFGSGINGPGGLRKVYLAGMEYISLR
ncbi:uncharacterized protein LOC115087653 [Rhinatrema bivittatum]|uniref:uncharacterized protein LOC115087653 n=1 Tax=Rhinatrema bivittatum TaxID=194408 RepID=UPI00112EC323|nr:uncharacterized protein LOC115087653 [Rhinatrema bivittatum]